METILWKINNCDFIIFIDYQVEFIEVAMNQSIAAKSYK